MMINIPMLCYMAEVDMDEIVWDYLLIRLKNPADHALVDEITNEL